MCTSFSAGISEAKLHPSSSRLLQQLLDWPAYARLPGLDLLRIALLSPTSHEAFRAADVVSLILSQGFPQSDLDDKTRENTAMMSLRAIANLFKQEAWLREACDKRRSIFAVLGQHSRLASKNARAAFAVILQRWSIQKDPF